MSSTTSEVYVFGAGKLGRSLVRGLRQAGVAVTMRPARRGWPRSVRAPLIVLAVRDGQVSEQASALRAARLAPGAAVVHCAGALGVEALSALKGRAALGKMHPLVSLAGAGGSALTGAWLAVAGDPVAVRRARRVARALRMHAIDVRDVDPVLYHAAAVVVAAGAAALVASASSLLSAAGVGPEHATAMLAPLLKSMSANIAALGLPQALTGPQRRGDHRTVEAHLRALAERFPEALPLYAELGRVQLRLGRQLGEASLESCNRIGKLLTRAAPRDRRPRGGR